MTEPDPETTAADPHHERTSKSLAAAPFFLGRYIQPGSDHEDPFRGLGGFFFFSGGSLPSHWAGLAATVCRSRDKTVIAPVTPRASFAP